MLKLCNFSAYDSDLAILNYNTEEMTVFLAEHGLEGFELLIGQSIDTHIINHEIIKGVHLPFWPNWLDFWGGETAQLLAQFGSYDHIKRHYGGLNKETLVENYRTMIKKAAGIGASYAVFHISNARPDEIFNYRFHYDDEMVINAAIEMLNAILRGLNTSIKILFENLWWPGLTLLNNCLTTRLFAEVHYPYKGIMLDTGHLMNTNRFLRTEREGIDYILTVLQELGELKQYIYGIHLHHSLSGAYVQSTIKNTRYNSDSQSIMEHILRIDQHLPFTDSKIQEVIEYVKPDYLVHEFLFRNRVEWSKWIRMQNSALYN